MRDIKAVFDIGNDTIKAVVFGKDNERDIILAKQMEPALGLKKGKILDAEAFTTTINKIIENFIKKLGGDFIEEVVVGVSHPEMLVHRIIEGKRIMEDEIRNDDIEHLSRIVAEISTKNNYETIKIVPVCWIIDEEKREKDPIGLKCKKLELMADVFMLPKNFYTGLVDAFDKVGLSISDMIPNIIAATEIAIDYDHKDLGTVLVDIGKNQTSYVIYEDGYPLGYGTIPMGGEDVTKDISIGMQVDIKEAEEIKKTHGMAMLAEGIKADSQLDIVFLTEIINARYEEIFLKVNQHLERIEKDGRLPGGILLIGGGSKMQNLDFLAKNVFKLATFYGKDLMVNVGDLSLNIQFINLLGIYYWSNKYMDIASRKMSFRAGKALTKLGNFFKDLF
ncbi:MAG: cell division protein FtsA [candidate division SR1 bacterium]|nr:MAG: cell division protein FtsA [candidate division SR1 bacterium]